MCCRSAKWRKPNHNRVFPRETMKLNSRCAIRRALFAVLSIAVLGLIHPSACQAAEPERPATKKVAAIVTTYFHNSHADVIVSRLLQTDTLDSKGRRSSMKLASLYIDQIGENDI